MKIQFAVAGLLSLLVLAAPAAAAEDDAQTEQTEQTCQDCPQPRPHYDSQEVIKTTRDVDRSRVINTTTVVPVPPRVREHNHLVIHENETRNVGVVLHRNTIIEKEIRYRRRAIAVQPYEGQWTVIEPYESYRTVYRGRGLFEGTGCGCGW